ncbi:hypothetical protein BvRS1_33360 [Burkholderia vietnamiensis]|nr:hypothetical protein BvRS1_33360 [Burkholderia vietnamiensis]
MSVAVGGALGRVTGCAPGLESVRTPSILAAEWGTKRVCAVDVVQMGRARLLEVVRLSRGSSPRTVQQSGGTGDICAADLTRSNAMGGGFVGADEIPAELF